MRSCCVMQASAGLIGNLGTAVPAYRGFGAHTAGERRQGLGAPICVFACFSRRPWAPEESRPREPQTPLGPVGVDFGPREGLRGLRPRRSRDGGSGCGSSCRPWAAEAGWLEWLPLRRATVEGPSGRGRALLSASYFKPILNTRKL